MPFKMNPCMPLEIHHGGGGGERESKHNVGKACLWICVNLFTLGKYTVNLYCIYFAVNPYDIFSVIN